MDSPSLDSLKRARLSAVHRSITLADKIGKARHFGGRTARLGSQYQSCQEEISRLEQEIARLYPEAFESIRASDRQALWVGEVVGRIWISLFPVAILYSVCQTWLWIALWAAAWLAWLVNYQIGRRQ